MPFLPDIYNKPEDFLDDLSKNIPPILYKCRDFNNPFHLSSLSESTVWYSSPRSLNDPFDIRVPLSINYEEVFAPRYFLQVFETFEKIYPNLPRKIIISKTEELLRVVRKDPEKWFDNNTCEIQENPIWDLFGVLSLSHDPLNEMMWAHYGSNGTGFCIGYNTLDIYFKAVHPRCGNVTYTDEIMTYSLLENNYQFTSAQMFLKNKKWEHEKEYRFVRDIQTQDDRLIKLSKSAIKEVILGKNVTSKSKASTIDYLKNVYNSKVKLFELIYATGSYGFRLKKIEY